MTWTPSAAKTSSKARVNLLSRSRTRNRATRPSAAPVPARSIENSRARWTAQGPFGWSVTPANRTRRVPSSMMNKTYRVLRPTVSTVKKSVARMAVAWARRNARQDGRGLGAKERSPGDRCPSGRRSQPVAKQHGPDGGRRHLDSELLELALDAPVTPARILPRQPQDQRYQMVGQRWTAASTGGPRPLAGHQPPVPPQDRVRGHQEDRPALARERAAQQREQRPIGRGGTRVASPGGAALGAGGGAPRPRCPWRARFASSQPGCRGVGAS